MGSFQWNDNFITGLSEVDKQHRHLVDLVNQFSDLLVQNELVFGDIELLFGELAGYAQYHFQEEEALVSRFGVDQRHTKQHRKEHVNFLKEVTTMHAAVTPENPDAAKPLLKFLTDWLAYHILGSDQNMARQIESIKAGKSATEAYGEEERQRDNATGSLLTALNSLFQQISSRNRALFELNQTLEAKVTERTKELSEANRRLEEIALTDVLTKLPNRRHAMQQMKMLWKEAVDDHIPLGCMIIDADNFKEINDTYGHDAGDVVLQELSRELRGAVRNDDIVCRLGGDEFFIICPNTPLEGAMYIAANVRKAVDALRVSAGEGEWRGSISVGVAVRTLGMEKPDALIKAADEGVYLAKRAGRNCVKTVEAQ